jgi:DNA adenine methylase
MPTYQGGKARIGAELYDVMKHIESDLGWKSREFFEPFCGMLSVGIHAARDGRTVIACDMNKDLMLMWEALQKGWMPRQNYISKADYNRLRENKKSSPVKGFFGVCCAFGGIYLNNYRIQKHKGANNSIVQFKDSLKKDYLPYLKNVMFVPARSYDQFEGMKGVTIYADPPYLNNTYKGLNKLFNFDHKHFWNVMRKWSKNNLVFVSEYVAPADFVCVWEKTVSISHTSSKKRTEKLFVHKSHDKQF